MEKRSWTLDEEADVEVSGGWWQNGEQGRRMNGASAFVECGGVLGGQFLVVVGMGKGPTWCKWQFVSNELLIVRFQAGYLAPDCPLRTNGSGTGCL